MPTPEYTDEDASLNPSRERRFQEIVSSRLGRRTLVAGGLATAAGFLAAGTSGAGPLDDLLDLDLDISLGGGRPSGPLLGFTAIGTSQADTVVVPAGYTATPLLPWGTPILGDYPAFRPGANTAAEQAQQMGTEHDGMHFFPLGLGRARNRHGLLVMNHEAADEKLVQTGSLTGTLPPDSAWTAEMVAKSQAAHGVAIVEVFNENGEWKVVRGKLNRRITANTPMKFTGPARGHRLLKTMADPNGTSVLGTFNNCAHGYTPWGTYLTCEENFNGYFRIDGSGFNAETSGLTTRYGVGGDRNKWALADPRFRVTSANPNEPNRFGWVAEIDPLKPNSTPNKRTALGRLKHENAVVVTAKGGEVVVYMGDDQVNEYLYKFVGRRPWRSEIARGRSPLDDGTLYVAKFSDDGSGQWIPLIQGQGPLTAANGFADEGDVLIKTRLAATLVGATPMDRPEWVAVNPRTSRVYVTCTNNTSKTVANAANPRVPNRYGHIVCWEENKKDHGALSFVWNLLAVAGAGVGAVPTNPPGQTLPDGSNLNPADAFGSPDGLWSDDDGRLWIQTDGAQPIACNNQMLVADLANRPAATPGTATGLPDIRRFLVGPKGCEITGVIETPDQRTMFVNIQHPGEGVPSTWPDSNPSSTAPPRSATVVITRNDGGVIGS
ncbi:PhoX family phosphatase [Sporichthya sp.]|uniref:PhoX family protein n=1 Tax=Sporichthya sp. TaxID=65475 RepID=UPI0017B012F6|nr:PhoX family phosphatase [Sporichthya sp.]MBA3742244.1 PhoX family phosphatase [Sporichthya sp.]